MPLINCKVELSLKCILSSGRNAATFAITDKKLEVPVVTLKSEDNAKLSKLLNERFKRSVYWNKYKAVLKDFAENNYIREQIDASFQGINRLFVLAYARGNNVADEDSYRRYFLPSSDIKNYNIEIDGRNFYDQAIDGTIKQYDEIRNISTGQGDDYTNGCLLDFALFEKN